MAEMAIAIVGGFLLGAVAESAVDSRIESWFRSRRTAWASESIGLEGNWSEGDEYSEDESGAGVSIAN